MLNENSELRQLIRKYALINAAAHGGKAQIGGVLGRILGEKAEYRSQVKELSAVINEVLAEVNGLGVEEQKRIVEENWPQTPAKKEKPEEKQLPDLPEADKYKQIITRFSPNPDCVLHLGSARAIVLSHEYARRYKGKFILRFEDTDPKVKKATLEFYGKIREDLKWLGCSADEEYIQSDRIPIYYEYAQKLLSDGHAYVCTCVPDEFREKTIQKQPCPCRSLPPTEQLKRWNNMLDGTYKEGEAVMRVKTDLDHPNPAARDWPALRIVDTQKHPHPRVGSKYRVWPLYNMAAGTDDHLMGMTHIIRGKEHLTNGVRQQYMYKYLGWEYPQAIYYGRLKITGAFLSKSKIIQGIKDKEFTGFDDPRLATFAALRKRGITPQAIKQMIIDVGPKTADVTLSWENLYAHNRKILDSQSNRYFFVADPTKLKVKALPKAFEAKLPLHPENPQRGSREYTLNPQGAEEAVEFWVNKQDAAGMEEGKVVRLMELFNITVQSVGDEGVEAVFRSEAYEDVRKLRAKLIHWIPVGQETPCTVVMPDAGVVEGFAEATCKNLKPNAVIQFERFGFARIEENTPKLTAYYAHK
ncbi:MAG: glutamate--tRNA ligase [Candidatus Bathyarchaeota archaeon]|nr:glutamate--tRNA ligase [Candidatus Bathyarchaeota archaeon]